MKIINVFATTAALAALMLGQVSLAQTDDRGIISQKRAVKGYEKRQRIMPAVESIYVSPSQLHEVYGLEVGAAGTYKQSTQTIENEDMQTQAPGFIVSTVYGGDMMVLGLDIAYQNINSKPESSALAPEFEENFYTVKPAVAMSFTDNVTLGISSDFTFNRAEQKAWEGLDADKISSDYSVQTAGVSYHTSKWEAGVAYSTFAKDSPNFDTSDEQVEIYIPAQTLAFARGNLTDNFSLMGTANFVDYERAAAAANPAFKNYRLEDRLGATVSLTYWTPARSSINVTGKYAPATAANQMIGSYNSSTGLANVYGGSIDYVRSFDKQQYIGLTAGFERGERDQTLEGTRYAAQQEKLTVGATFNAKI